jgi:hypothetical protein
MFAAASRLWSLGGLLTFVLGLALLGCATSQEAGPEPEAPSSPPSSDPGPLLAKQSETVRTVQLYRGTAERDLPIVPLTGEQALTLEFDLLEQTGRPLSVYFIHADRTWKRDLSPSQALASYHTDRLVDYRSSQGTEIPYTHYTYTFPNDDIRFRVSGNYILRVTERGRRDSVLFERPFFVTDEAGQLQAGSDAISRPGQSQPSVRPLAQYSPPASLRGDPFGYAVCFVRNGRLPDTRCQDRALLGQQPRLEFELSRSRAFNPATADYTLDLGTLRSTNAIERIDRTVSPYAVLLAPDYAQFSGQDVDASLNGQIVVRDAIDGRADPALSAEYVRTTFAFVPPSEQPLNGRVVVGGSFSGMDPDRGTALRWVPSRARYEGAVLLKQGRYQYFYHGTDSRLQRAIRRSQARLQNTYTTFVYYQDPSKGTDRLLRVSTFRR